MSDLLRTILLLGTVFLVHCGDGASECEPREGSIAADVTDALGNMVPVETGWIVQGDKRRDCQRTGPNGLSCPGWQAGPARLFVAANGAVVERTLDLVARPDHFGGCVVGYPSNLTYAFVHDAPKCDLSQVPSVRGELFLTPEQPVDARFARVRVESSGGSAACTQEQTRFWCPATSAVATSYVLQVDFGTTKLERMFMVALSGCHNPDPVELRIVRSERVCASDDRGSLQVFLTQAGSLGTAEHVLADRVRVRHVTSEWADCQLAPAPSRPEPRPFHCPALSTTGGGLYAVTIERGGRAEQVIVEVQDDGCQVLNGRVAVSFEKDQVCSRERCGPAGQVLNTTNACTRGDQDSLGLPPCRVAAVPSASDAGAP